MNLLRVGCLGMLLGLGASASRAADDLLVADFEGDNYGEWKTTGEAFGPGPARGALPGQMPVDGFLGKGLVNSYYKGDGTTGTLTSPPFRLERRYLRFLIGGGKHPDQTCIQLLIDGRVVRTMTGPNDRPGGTERLEPAQWDVAEFAGKSAVIEIVDRATGGWGHINIDHIIQTDVRLPELRTNVAAAIERPQRYLHLPVKTGGPKRRMRIAAGGETVREFEIELADGAPDFYVFLDLQPFSGRPLQYAIDKLPEDSQAPQHITTAAEVPAAELLYREAARPQFHFSSRRGWNNDPNGLVYLDGEYHLFYQHNPYGWAWGNMHWGHAVSRDLVRWEELPIALYPRQFGDWAFSGSAVVDRANTSGFQQGDVDVLVLAYTSTGRGECIAYSRDRGRTWTEFDGNPVVKHRGRDPRLLWHEPTRRWVMAVYHEPEVDGKVLQTIAFYTSPNLKEWNYESQIEGFYECPDLFELPVDGRAERKLWVLSAANSDYMLGRFDGRVFTPETPKIKGNSGNCLYAAQTFSDIPAADGRRIQIGWGTIATPGMPFNQLMTFPTELSLRTTPAGVRLCYQPVRELQSLLTNAVRETDVLLQPGTKLFADKTDLLSVQLTLAPQEAQQVTLLVRGAPLTYDVRAQKLTCRDRSAAAPLRDGQLSLQVLVDRTSLEIFAQDGEVYMPLGGVNPAEVHPVALTITGGPARLKSLTISDVQSIWRR